MLGSIGNQLRERLLPSAGAKLNDALRLISRAKTTLNSAPFKIQVSCYDFVAPQVEQSVLYDIESALENRQVLSFDYNNHRCEVDPYASFVYQKYFILSLESVTKEALTVAPCLEKCVPIRCTR